MVKADRALGIAKSLPTYSDPHGYHAGPLPRKEAFTVQVDSRPATGPSLEGPDGTVANRSN